MNEFIHGKCKEYKDGKLIFEGEYLNGRKNRKGKEYKDGKLIFEGEFFEKNKIGKGREYGDNINI